MKQPWFCEACGATGTCTIPRGSGVFHGLTSVRKAHARKSGPCAVIHGDAFVRVRNPRLCGPGEWQDMIHRVNADRAREEKADV